jgi:hypothetical protein
MVIDSDTASSARAMPPPDNSAAASISAGKNRRPMLKHTRCETPGKAHYLRCDYLLKELVNNAVFVNPKTEY